MKIKILLFLLFLFNSAKADYNSVNIAWDNNCPWMCSDPNKPGFLSELVSEIFRLSNIKVQYQKYSWAEAKLEVKEGRILGILSPTKDEAEGFYFPKKHLAKINYCFYVNKSLKWSYKNENSLQDIKLGISFRNSYHDLTKYIRNNQNDVQKIKLLNVADIYETGFELLQKKQFDAFLIDRTAAEYYLNKVKKIDQFKRVGCLHLEKIFLAFTPAFQNKSKYLSEILDKNIEILKDNDFIENLKLKYNIPDVNFSE